MSSTFHQLASKLSKIIIESDDKKPKAYDTKAVVKKVDDDTLWVEIPGGNGETPVQKTYNAKIGDTIMIRCSKGKAWAVGNNTSPATDDTVALAANDMAVVAGEAANLAIDSANNAQDAAARANGSAEEARIAALSATASANSALVQLSVIEDVSGTLDWIKKHGRYVLTTDTTVQEGTIYFIYNQQTQDYEPIVSPDQSKNPSEEGWFVLDITDSQTEYIMAHLALTARGLWILPDGLGDASDPQYAPKYKALLSTDALYIYNSSGVQLSKLGIESIIGDSSGSHLYLNKNQLQMFDKTGSCYMYFSDLCGDDGRITTTKTGTKGSSNLIMDSSPYTISAINLESVRAINGNKTITIHTIGYDAVHSQTSYDPRVQGYTHTYQVCLYKEGDSYTLVEGDSIIINYTIDGVANTFTASGPRSSWWIQYYKKVTSTSANPEVVKVTSVRLNGEEGSRNYFYNAGASDNYLKAYLTSSFAETGDECTFEYDVTDEAKAFTLGSRRPNSKIGQFSYCFGKSLTVENPYEVAIGKYNRRRQVGDDLFSVSYGTEDEDKTFFRISNDGNIRMALRSYGEEWYNTLTNAGFNPYTVGTDNNRLIAVNLNTVILTIAKYIADSASS